MADNTRASQVERERMQQQMDALAQRLGVVPILETRVADLQQQLSAREDDDTTIRELQQQVADLSARTSRTPQPSLQPGVPESLSTRITAKAKTPSTYSGDRRDDLVGNWVADMADYLHICAAASPLSDVMKLQIASTYLDGEAKRSWRRRQNRQPSVTTWAEFSSWIRAQFTDLNHDRKVRDRYNDLRQTHSAQSYANELRKLADMLVIPPPDTEILEKFRTGLKPTLSAKLQLVPATAVPSTLEEFISYIEQMDTYPAVRTSPISRLNIIQTRPSRRQLMARGQCFHCHENGHRMADCPKRQAPAPAPKE